MDLRECKNEFIKIFGKEFLVDDVSIKEKIGYISERPGFLDKAKLKHIKISISRFYKNWDDSLYNSYITTLKG